MSQKNIARLGDDHFCPKCKVVSSIISGCSFYLTDGRPTALVGDRIACGAVILVGSSLTKVEGKGVAHVGSVTSHGGRIISGSHTSGVLE